MIDQAIRAKIKLIKIHTKRLIQSGISGDYLSAFKGSGLEFDRLREYQSGDDVRFIDWNCSAKMNKIMVKEFVEERDRTVILCIDVSASSLYSSQKDLRKDTISQLAATLTFVAQENKDKVGALFFSDKIEKWIPPSKSNVHIGKIIETIFSLKPNSKKTNITEALKFLASLKKRGAIVFMISDWIDTQEQYTKLLKIASLEYDFLGVRVLDQHETSFPDIGLIDIQDPESGQIYTLDSKNKLNTHLKARILEQKDIFRKHKIDLLDLTVGEPFINPLIKFFHQRTRRQI
ncbi:MAG: DUF58 domain-containing protein [bacterium]